MKKLSIVFSVLLCLFVVSCNSIDFGNVNKDDDAVTSPSTEGLMSGAMNQFFTMAGRNGQTKPNLYVQYQTQRNYTQEQLYSASPASWQGYYVGLLSNFKKIVDINSADEVSNATRSYGAPVNQIGVSEIMAAFVWKRLTDIYGPVPYKDALGKGDTITPSYTDQETIYKDLVDRVKKARDKLDDSKMGPTGDVIYSGDVTKWKKFANSLILSLTMQLTNKYPSASGYAATEFKAALNNSAGVIQDVGDEAWYDYQNISGANNPFSRLRGADYQMSLPFTTALKGQANGQFITYSNDSYDNRLKVLAEDDSLDGAPYGRESLTASNTPSGLTDTYTSISSGIRAPDAPLPYMTAGYTYLNRAEAAQRGWTNENAQNMLRNGIMASYASVDDHWDDGDPSSGKLQSDGSNFAADRILDATNGNAAGGMLQVIDEEKWVAVFPIGFQAWSEFRRTGYPGLIPAVDAVNNGEIPTRYLYPNTETGVNGDNYDQALKMLSPSTDTNTSKFWWEMQ